MNHRTLWRLLDALTHTGPSYDPTEYRPRRGDAVERWLIAQRDGHADEYPTPPPGWWVLDAALRDFRKAADAGVGLGSHDTNQITA